MFIKCVDDGWSVRSSIKVEGTKKYVDTYFVIEHQPSTCSQYPKSGKITFDDIAISINNKPITPQWTAKKYQDACDCTPKVLSSSSVQFTWNTA
mmetsp:Transcript_26792/g.29871  ORF Transcript_26792/g.29871 Transcript_26792/m.29871 type:complete len:94 (-) Transcript_26792:81-362(-)